MKKISAVFFCLLYLFLYSGVSYGDIFGDRPRRDRAKDYSPQVPLTAKQPPAEPLYEKIFENYLKENYAAVDRLTQEYLAVGKHSSQDEDVLYLRALSLIKLGRETEGRRELMRLEAEYSSEGKKSEVSTSLADSYFYEGDYARAAESYREILKKYPGSSQTSYAEQGLKKSLFAGGLSPSPVLGRQSVEESPLFSVQVGSFSKRENAENLVGELTRKKYDAYVTEDSSQKMSRVRVGHYASKEDAVKTQMQLDQEGYPTKIVP